MARKPRIHFPGAFYHVIARGNQRQDIFLDEGQERVSLGIGALYPSKSCSSCGNRSLARKEYVGFILISQTIIKLENLIQRHKEIEEMVEFIESNLTRDRKKKYDISITPLPN